MCLKEKTPVNEDIDRGRKRTMLRYSKTSDLSILNIL